ncbi:MAG: phosphonopyruvate decarboxylase, partial [Pseudomonadota bacterium]
MKTDAQGAETGWPDRVFDTLRAAEVAHASYVPDAGHARLIQRFVEDPATMANVLTTEEEGVAIACGAWAGGMRSVLLMQSSGVGNCINMLSLPVLSRTPFLTLVTMRGEHAEFNPWQMPMSHAVRPSLEAIGLTVMRADEPKALIETVAQAAHMAFNADQQIAVLIGQRMIGAKKW